MAKSAGLTGTSSLGILDPAGQPVPAQFKVTARWGGPVSDSTKPIRWLLADFPASAGADTSATYRFVTSTTSGAGSISTTETSSQITLDTGAGVFAVSKTAFTVLSSATVGGQQVLNTSDPSNGFVFEAPDGTTVRSGSAGSLLSSDIDEVGPARVTVRQVWEFESPAFADDRSADWSSVYTSGVPWLYDSTEAHRSRIRVTTWTTFVRSSTAVRVRARIENPNTCMVRHSGGVDCVSYSSTNSVMFEDATLHLGLAGTNNAFRTGDGQTGSTTGELAVYQESSGRDSWDHYKNFPASETWNRYARDVTFRGYKSTLAGSPIGSGDQTAGWIEAGPSGSGPSAAVGIAEAWKQYPAALRAASGGSAIEAAFYPAAFPRAHTLRAAEGKAHDASLFFGADAGGSEAAAAHAWVGSPLRARLQPSYIEGTGAMPGLSASGKESTLDTWNLTTIDKSVSDAHNSSGWWSPPSMLLNQDATGHWGKEMSGFQVNDNEQETSTDLSKYNQYQGFLRQSLALPLTDTTHSDTWWRVGVDANRAQAEGGYLAQPYAVKDQEWNGINASHCFHEYTMQLDYPRGQGWCDFSGDIGGMFELYALTGWEPALPAIDYHLNNIYLRSNPASLSYEVRQWGGPPARKFGSFMETLVTGWEVTGNRKYLDRAAAMAAILAQDDNTYYLDCPCASDPPETWYVNAFFVGWLTRSLGRIADELKLLGEEGGPSYAQVTEMLDRHATWFRTKVIFTDAVSGRKVMPYYWYTYDPAGNGNDPNSSPAYSSYALIATDALAYSYRHGGNEADLSVAHELFDSTMALPFSWGWQVFTYSTINDAGKYAEFGGVFINELHTGGGPAATAISGSVPGGDGAYVSIYSASDGHLVTWGPAADGTWSFDVPPASCPAGYKVLIQAPAGYQTRWLGNHDNFTSAPCVSAPSSGNDMTLPASARIEGYVKSAADASDIDGAHIFVYRASTGAPVGYTWTANGGRYGLELEPGTQYRLLVQPGPAYEDSWFDGGSGFPDSSPTTPPATANFSLRQAATISGSVTQYGAPLPGAVVAAYPSCGCDYPQNTVAGVTGAYSVKVASTAASGGSYRLRFIPPAGQVRWYPSVPSWTGASDVTAPSSGINQDVPA